MIPHEETSMAPSLEENKKMFRTISTWTAQYELLFYILVAWTEFSEREKCLEKRLWQHLYEDWNDCPAHFEWCFKELPIAPKLLGRDKRDHVVLWLPFPTGIAYKSWDQLTWSGLENVYDWATLFSTHILSNLPPKEVSGTSITVFCWNYISPRGRKWWRRW